MKTLNIPPYLKNYAHGLTTIRVKDNKERYEGTHKHRPGFKDSILLGSVPRDYYTDYVGILGELLVRHYLETSDEIVRYTASTLLKKQDDITDDSDIIAYSSKETYRISVKTCEKTFKANKRAIDIEEADIVIFIMFTSPDTYLLSNFSPDQVRSWNVVTKAYSPYYELSPNAKM
tara:strand:- start:8328 stop:8852 length:525 start_codon:yes stop_codon:yes gene_type:complete